MAVHPPRPLDRALSAVYTVYTMSRPCRQCLVPRDGGEPVDVLELSLSWREKLALMFNVLPEEASAGELAAFLSFAMAYPNGFLALIDTYEVYRFARFYLFFFGCS